MKVLMLTNHLNRGGISAYVLYLCKALHGKKGVEMVVASRGGNLEKDFFGLGVEHILLPLTTKCEVSPKVFLSFLKLSKILKRSPVQLIHANTRVTQVLAALLSSSIGIPYISTCHGYFKTRLSRRFFPCWGQKVIAISDQVRDHLMRDFGLDSERIELIYHGVDLDGIRRYKKEEIKAEKRKLGLDVDKKVVGHIGRLSCVKGQRFLVLSAHELIQKRKDIQFLIIGDGEEERDLKKLIQEKNLDHMVFLRPSVDDTAVALSLMDVFVMPSLQEGLGISILEAQAQGVPVVASRTGGIPSIIEDEKTGLLVSVGDVHALSSAILRFLEDQELRDVVAENARDQIRKKFLLASMAQKTHALYEAVLGTLRC